MSARPGVVVNSSIDADGGESPNRFVAHVTAEVRVFWPPLATHEQIQWALDDAFVKATAAIKEKRS